jgi:hypothetical protein
MITLYHGTPVSGTREDARQFLTGRHGLVSFARPEQLDIVKDVCETYVLDNGAFSIWRKGGKLNPHKFMEWAHEHSQQSNFNFAFIPDIIDGNETDNDALIELWKEHNPCSGVPIWHLDESLDRLENLSNTWPIIAFGSSGSFATVGTQKWWARMAEALPRVCDGSGRPRCKLHGLRMMNPDIFTRIPFSSVDSTNATQNGSAQATQLALPEAWQGSTVIAWRLEKHTSPELWHPEYIQIGLL